jgi:probable phosphoglycerate mutase
MCSVLADISIDGIFSSPLGRAFTTAQVIGGGLGRQVLVIDELAELHHGDFAGLTNNEIDAAHPGEMNRRAKDKYHWRFPGGESYEDVDRRASIALDRIAEAGSRRPLLVTHEMIGRMLLRALLDLAPSHALERSLAHGVVLDVCPTGRTIRELPVVDYDSD